MQTEDDDISFTGAAGLSRALANHRLSPVEIVETFLERIDRLEPKLHAFVKIYRDKAVAEARAAERAIRAGAIRGPLHGVPVVLKDVIDLDGEITTAGSRSRLGSRATETSTVVRRLSQAGAIILGKVQTVEFALGGWGVNEGLGTPWNPWDLTTARTPGGSSSGCGVALAAGLAPLGIGTDMGGSIRLPASYSGVTGLKTTRGRVSNHGVVPATETLDTVGPMARSAEDAALLYNAIKGADARDENTWSVAEDDPSATLRGGVRGLRLAAMPDVERGGVDDEIIAAYDRSLTLFSELGGEVVELELPFRFADLFALDTVARAESHFLYGHMAADPEWPMDEAVRRRLLAGASVTMTDYLQCRRELARLQRILHDATQGVDALLTPTTPTAALPLAKVDLGRPGSRFTRFVNLLGLCALALPNGFNREGLPLSLQIVCPAFQEATALRIGRAFQDVSDWHERRPAL
jgi:aspartyl-tRNA(Asn)/glutamyl-tRNA(Gln) amidotransferase subunit A